MNSNFNSGLNSDLFSKIIPARLSQEQAAKFLGFQSHNIPILITYKLLKPLGSPAPNAPKYFATVRMRELAANEEWLDKASKIISKHWKAKNSRKINSQKNLSLPLFNEAA